MISTLSPAASVILALPVAVGALAVAPAVSEAASEPLLRDLMGINGHTVNFDPVLYAPAATHVRDYHNFNWDVDIASDGTGGDTNFPMTHNNWFSWDAMYGDWVDKGYRINPAIQFATADDVDVDAYWDDLPADAYKYGQTFAAHFGPTQGNGLAHSIQIGNEMVGYTDAEYRTLFQNMAEGVRAADPNLPIVTAAATAGPSSTYSKSLSGVFTGLDDLYDVIAVHTYPHLTGWPTWKPSHPEDDQLAFLTRVQDVIDWRDQNAPGKQVWVTEFGYDASTQSPDPTTEFKDWIDVTDTQQAQYLTRSYLLFSGMDVDRAYMYFFNDSDTPHLHGSSGLTRNFNPKPSYWAVSHLQKTLGDYRFDSIVEKSEDDLYIYAFAHETDPDKVIWVLWSPTGSDRQVEVTLDDLIGNVLGAELMPLVAGDAPLVSFTALGEGSIRLNVGESPTYLFMQIPEPASAMLVAGGCLVLLRRRPGRDTD